ncbi:hypothetical protein ACI797_21155 [Geodermatophilus sp. SYSU D00691]
MDRDTTTRSAEQEARALLHVSGGKPIVQIVWDPESDTASIRCAGLDHAVVPRLVLNLGLALTGER